jgi:6-phosphogluconolactonase (cycloisomerase 2 family)
VLADATNGVVYACDKCLDNPDFADKGGGGDVYSYAFSRDGTAVKLDSSLSYGANPSALVLSADGNFLGTAIAGGGGTATVLKTNEKGLLEVGFCYSERSFVLRQIEHDGSVGAVSDRYLLNPDGVPSAPCDVKRAPSGEFFLLCDRDASTLYSFKLRPESGELYLGADPFVEPDGSRASRCVFHPTGPWAYASSADLPQLLALSYEENGALTQTQNVAPIERPEMYDARSDDYRYTQDFLCASADGRFVYCGARLSKGINSEYELVAVFSVDAQSGLLTPLQYYFLENAQGACAAALSPDGRWLVVACRYSCELLTLRVADDGRLELHDRYSVATPSSICWYKHE